MLRRVAVKQRGLWSNSNSRCMRKALADQVSCLAGGMKVRYATQVTQVTQLHPVTQAAENM